MSTDESPESSFDPFEMGPVSPEELTPDELLPGSKSATSLRWKAGTEAAPYDDGGKSLLDAVGGKPFSLEECVQWALENVHLYNDLLDNLRDTAGARRMLESAPHGAAISFLQAARNNNANFMSAIVPKILAKRDAPEERAMEDDRRKMIGIVERSLLHAQCPHCFSETPPVCPDCKKSHHVPEIDIPGLGGM